MLTEMKKGPDGSKYSSDSWTNEHFEGGGVCVCVCEVIAYVKCKRRNTNSITNFACIMNLFMGQLRKLELLGEWSELIPLRVLCMYMLSCLLLSAM